MAAIWMRARSELRARRRQVIGLALLLGLLGGVVIAAGAGARRVPARGGPLPPIRTSWPR